MKYVGKNDLWCSLDVYKRQTYHIQGSVEQLGQLQDNEILYELDNEQLWRDKINEIRTFKCDISDVQKEKLINVYNRYRHVFSDTPGKVRNYQCKIEFREPVNFNRKSYPIAYSQKEAVSAEINQLISCLLYTSV